MDLVPRGSSSWMFCSWPWWSEIEPVQRRCLPSIQQMPAARLVRNKAVSWYFLFGRGALRK